ncbi:unnamed protein product [Dibothriocephalus latus]|uniref:Uncharacterized protein n=1 Tax=Dibothriocephalus latus TaxID=60516 RepID=A0A3P7M8I9_DIBLA|nr:unnamed protein product [Dibothriocephalus latus]
MLLVRPSDNLLWAGVFVKEIPLTRTFHSELVAASRCSAHAQAKMEYLIALVYWIQRWTTFYQTVSFKQAFFS